jgi:ethanolamine utilization microcompartment shell protein EutS
VILVAFSLGLALRIAVSVSAMTVTPVDGRRVAANVTVSYRRIAIGFIGRQWTKKRPETLLLLGFLAFVRLQWI